MSHIVVVGAGLAGARSVEALRGCGHQDAVTLIGAEDVPPYDRPPLSKAMLAGTVDDTTLPTEWQSLDVRPRLGVRATGLRPGTVETTEGPLDFDGLIIATGATPVRLPGPGHQHVLRTVDDARALRATLRPERRIAVVGAGWIGAEVATAAAAAGARVTVVEAADAPLATAIGSEIGGWTRPWYDAAGVELRLDTKIASVEHDGLALADGSFVPADEVVVGVGVRPEVGWLAGSDVRVENGVHVDAYLRSSMPGVIAVGDCAAFWSSRYGRRLRVEHWDSALNAPQVAAANVLGGTEMYDPVPYFWSEQFGRMVQYVGHHPAGDTLVWRGHPGDSRWSVCWIAGDTLAAILTVDRPRDLVQARRVISAGKPIDPVRLADSAVAVRDATR